MRKLVAVTAVAWVIAGAAGSSLAVAGGSKRVEERPYAAAPQGVNFYTDLGYSVGEVTFPPGAERYVEVVIADAAGGAVAAEVIQGTRVSNICGATESPLAIRPDVPVTVRLYVGRCADGVPSVATNGEVTATFTKTAPDALRQVRSYSPYEGTVGYSDGRVRVATVHFHPLTRRVAFTVGDQSGTSVMTVVRQGGDVVEGGTEIGRFCGSTDAPVRVKPDLPIWVDVWSAPQCGASGPSTVTRGTVVAEFLESRS